MVKRYEYDKKEYFWRVTVIGAVGAIAAVYSVIQLLINPTANYFYVAVLIVGFYTFWETYISAANPSAVEIADDELKFYAYGKVYSIKKKDIKEFKVKEFSSAKKMFIRINNPGFLNGRYWVNCYWFNDRDELFQKIRDLEVQLEPDSLKAYTRKTGEKEFQERQRKKLQKKK